MTLPAGKLLAGNLLTGKLLTSNLPTGKLLTGNLPSGKFPLFGHPPSWLLAVGCC